MKPINNILMTGAGMVGSRIIKLLNERYNIKPIVVDQYFQYDYLDTIIDRDQYIQEECSILDEDKMREIMKKYDIDAVLHTAAVLPMRVGHDPHPGFFKVNTWGTTNLIFSALEAGVTRFVMFSTNGVYQFRKYGVDAAVKEDYPSGMNLTNAYGNSKATVEFLLKELTNLGKIDAKIIRPGEIFGPVMNRGNDDPIYWKAMADAAIKGEPFVLKGHPEHKLDWVHCNDVSNVALLALMEGGEHMEYHAASGKLSGIYQLKAVIDELYPDNQVTLEDCATGGWNYPLSMERVKETFGYEPEYDLKKGIKEYADWFLKNHPQ